MSSRSKGLWKLNCSLLSNDRFKTEMKIHISSTLSRLDQERVARSAIKCSKLTIETLVQGKKYVQS